MKTVKNTVFLLLISLFIWDCQDENPDNYTDKNNFFLVNLPALQKGDFVLAPSKSTFDTAKNSGFENSLFVFYPRTVLYEKNDSVFVDEIGDTVALPKALIIPMKKNVKVSKGDLVLTWWQNGTGMQRAVVISNEPTNTPIVYYIDNQYTFYSPSTDINFWIDTLQPNSFLPIEDKLMSGRSILIDEDYLQSFYIIINVSPDQSKVLALSWSGVLKVFDTGEIKLIPLQKHLQKGDSVAVPYLGSFCYGTVTGIWKDIGKISADVFFIDTITSIYANIADAIKIEKQ